MRPRTYVIKPLNLYLITRDKASKFEKMYHHGSFYAPLLIPLTFYPKLFRNMLTDESLDSKKLVEFN